MGRLVTATLWAAILECMSAATYRASKQCKQPRIRQHTDGIVLVARPFTAENRSTPLTKQVWRTFSNARRDRSFGIGVQSRVDDLDSRVDDLDSRVGELGQVFWYRSAE